MQGRENHHLKLYHALQARNVIDKKVLLFS